jgi:hypothetical protein
MKRFFTLFNSAKFLLALFRVLIGLSCIVCAVFLLKSNDPPGLGIVGAVIRGCCGILIVVVYFEALRDAYRFVKSHTKQERYELDDILICRVKGGKVQ